MSGAIPLRLRGMDRWEIMKSMYCLAGGCVDGK